MEYNMTELMERLGNEATLEDAEAAWERAEDWYNSSSNTNQDILAWYESYRLGNQHAADINDQDDQGRLIDDWELPVIFYRAASLADL